MTKKSIRYLLTILLAAAICYFIFTFALVPGINRGISNDPTIQDGDLVLNNNLVYRLRAPERFEMISFRAKDGTLLNKRVIGLPGETVQIDYKGSIYINGRLLEENYCSERILDPGRALYSVTLSDDEYFVLGDNRNYSNDSRKEEIGNIRREDIVGKPLIILFPFSRFRTI